MIRWTGRVQHYLDLAMAGGVLALAELEVATDQVPGPTWVGVLAGAVFGLPLAVRRRWVTASAAVLFGGIVVTWLLGLGQYNNLAEVVAGVASLYTVGAHLPLRRSVITFGAAYVCVAVASLSGGVAGYLWGLIVLGGAWSAGRAMRGHRAVIAQLKRTTRELQQAREAHLRAALADERARIARELHDVVAHSVSVMVVQADAADRLVDSDPDRARTAVAAIQDTGRQALTELRRLLGVLRPDSAAAALTPQPTLAELPDLARRMTAAGLRVDLERAGDLHNLPVGLDLAAYRIVQEALTNSLKHANAERAVVTVACADGELRLEIEDTGTSAPVTEPGGEPGHGLIGMRERASVYGGRVEAGPVSGGGFRVLAHLPLNPV